MSDDDRRYYHSRAEAELELAQRATHRGVLRAHFEMASAYLDRIAASDTSGKADDA